MSTTSNRAPSRLPSRYHRVLGGALALVGLLFGQLSAAFAEEGLVDPSQMPAPLKTVTLEQRLGSPLPLDARFRDDSGRDVTLGTYLNGDKPVILLFVYYECPMLCTMVLNGLSSALKVLEFNPGKEFEVVAISIDPAETHQMASEAKRRAVQRYGRLETLDGWHFLTTKDEATIRRVADAAGFGYEYLPATDEFAHASGVIVVTPQGKLAQYFYGIEYSPKDLRLALVESSSNRLGTVVDQLLLYCYRYDPHAGKYTALAMRLVRIGGAVFALGMIIFLWLTWRRERAKDAAQTAVLGAR